MSRKWEYVVWFFVFKYSKPQPEWALFYGQCWVVLLSEHCSFTQNGLAKFRTVWEKAVIGQNTEFHPFKWGKTHAFCYTSQMDLLRKSIIYVVDLRTTYFLSYSSYYVNIRYHIRCFIQFIYLFYKPQNNSPKRHSIRGRLCGLCGIKRVRAIARTHTTLLHFNFRMEKKETNGEFKMCNSKVLYCSFGFSDVLFKWIICHFI